MKSEQEQRNMDLSLLASLAEAMVGDPSNSEGWAEMMYHPAMPVPPPSPWLVEATMAMADAMLGLDTEEEILLVALDLEASPTEQEKRAGRSLRWALQNKVKDRLRKYQFVWEAEADQKFLERVCKI
jgi:hypothetical protein